MSKKNESKNLKDLIETMRAQGLTTLQIANKTGISLEKVRRVFVAQNKHVNDYE